MKFKDLLIIDIGRSFLFGSLLKFADKKGFKLDKQQFTRYPKYLEISELEDIFPQSDNMNVIFINNSDKKTTKDFEHDLIIRDTKYWKKSFKSLVEKLEMKKAAYISFNNESIQFNSINKFQEEKFSLFNWEFIRQNIYILNKIGLTRSEIINFLSFNPPLPQQITDFQKSFILGYLFAEYVSEKFNLENVDYLIISSEYFKSGFFDKSGFLEFFVQNNKSIKNISFDSYSIWSILINDSLNEYAYLEYLNREVFLPEFSLVHEKIDKLNIIEGEEKKEIHLLSKYQLFIDNSGKKNIEIEREEFEIINSVYIKSDLDLKNIQKFDYFRDWYKFFSHRKIEYKQRLFDDLFEHELNSSREILNEKFRVDYFYDLEKFFKKNKKINYKVVEGELVRQNDVIARVDKLGGIMFKELKSKYNSKVKKIDNKAAFITVETKEVINNIECEVIKDIDKNNIRIKINATRMDAVFIGKQLIIGTLNHYKDVDEDKFNQILWVRNNQELKELLSNIELFQPKSIIVPTMNLDFYLQHFSQTSRYNNILSIIVLNGFDNSDKLNMNQNKFLSLNSSKPLIIDKLESSIYAINSKGKFDGANTAHTPRKYCKVFTFDDWNLEGELVYNDEDTKIFKSETGSFFDVQEFNSLVFNHDRSTDK